MITRTRIAMMATSLSFILAAGCRSEEGRQLDEPAQKPAELQPPQPQPQPQPAQPAQPAPPAVAMITAVVVVDTKLAALCELPHTHVFFEFDAAKLQPEAKEHLDLITQCVREGKAKGRELRVVGHTDPRGDEAYNQQLGKQRAESVSSYLQAQGVAQPRIDTLSRGQELADPNEPASFPRDRRVTIRLAE